MGRCDICKHQYSDVCEPYSCEHFEVDLSKHDAQIKSEVIEEFVNYYKDFSQEVCLRSGTGVCEIEENGA